VNKTRIIGLVVGAAVVVGVILISLGFKAAPEAQGSNPAFTGFGDLRRFENQLDRSSGGAQSNSSSVVVSEHMRRLRAREALLAKSESNSKSYAGMGDVQRMDAAAAKSALSSASNNAAYAGMGDVTRYGASIAGQALAVASRSSSSAGMGDVQRFGAVTANAALSSASDNAAYAGLGDVTRYGASIAGQALAIASRSSSSYVGMGDLHLFEASQEDDR
jgi:hypothetical protein